MRAADFCRPAGAAVETLNPEPYFRPLALPLLALPLLALRLLALPLLALPLRAPPLKPQTLNPEPQPKNI